MQFTVGTSPITVYALGAPYSMYDDNPRLKLVNAQTGMDVTGGSGGTFTTLTSPFYYTYLPAPIVLPANTSYYLLFQTKASPRYPYSYGATPVTNTSDAIVNGAVYTDASGKPVLVPGSAGEAYGPLSFLYELGSGSNQPPIVTVIGASIQTFTATAIAAPDQTISSLQFQIDNQNFGPPQTASSSTASFSMSAPGIPDYNDILDGSHIVTAIATDSAGNVGTSTPVAFQVYTSGAVVSTALITGQAPKTLRNDYGDSTGKFVGMKFTVGINHLAVFELGRFAAPGNKQSHIVKLVDAATGLDVPGGSVTVSMSGSTSGQYVYGYLPISIDQPAKVILRANASYYLLSQEFTAGDEWYDIAPVTAGSPQIPGEGAPQEATVTGPVYQAPDGSYVEVQNIPGAAYGPLNLAALPESQYNLIYVGITLPTPTTVAGLLNLDLFADTAGYYIPATSIQPLLDGVPFGSPYIPSTTQFVPYLLDTTKLTNGPHVMTVTATDAAGDTATSARYNVTVKNPVSQSSGTSLLSAFKPTFLRNNFSGYVGMEFTLGATQVTVSSLGRLCVTGNSGSHELKLVQASNGSDLPGGSVSVSMPGCSAGQFTYAPLATPLTLPAGASYYLASQETAGGDQWYDDSPVSIGFGAATVNPVYSNGSSWVTVDALFYSYVPVDIQFAPPSATGTVTVTTAINGATVTAKASSTVAAIAGVQFQVDGINFYPQITTAPYTLTLPNLDFNTHLITAVAVDAAANSGTSSPISYTASFAGSLLAAPLNSFSGTKLRNDYTGWVGFQFTTGIIGDPLTSFVTDFAAIGMTCLTGNVQPVFVKLVLASTGADVPGSLAWLDPSQGCYTGGILYSNIGATLSSSTTYYLVAQETAGGEPWYDIGPAVPMRSNSLPRAYSVPANFTIDGPVYFDGQEYVLVPTPNYSYVGLYFGGATHQF